VSANILKIEAFSGMSGDMFLGALAELSGGYDELRKLPEKLGLKNVEVNVTAVVKTTITAISRIFTKSSKRAIFPLLPKKLPKRYFCAWARQRQRYTAPI